LISAETSLAGHAYPACSQLKVQARSKMHRQEPGRSMEDESAMALSSVWHEKMRLKTNYMPILINLFQGA
jgi:hypothetical protein